MTFAPRYLQTGACYADLLNFQPRKYCDPLPVFTTLPDSILPLAI